MSDEELQDIKTDDIDELYSYGSDCFVNQNYVKAEALLKEVIRLRPNFADVHNKLGVIASLKSEYERAAGHFEKALEINPNYTEAYLNLTITYNDMGQTDKAGELFTRVSAARKDAGFKQRGQLDYFAAGKVANEHTKLGNIYMDFNLQDEAIEEYKKAIGLRDDFVDVHTKLGMAYRDKKMFAEAEAAFKHAKEINTYYVPAYVHLGLAYYAQGRNDEARAEWKRALELKPDHKEARSFLNILEKSKK